MEGDRSITAWLRDLRAGDDAAAERIWQRFHLALVMKAHHRLNGSPVRHADAEDAVQEAFLSFFQRAKQGQFPQLSDRHELWSLLLAITERKALNQIRASKTKKRGSSRIQGESIFQISPTDSKGGIHHMAGKEPTPDDVAVAVESCDHLLSMLSPEQRRIAVYKLEGRTNEEIARLLDCAVATIERRLQLIRRKWKASIDA